MKSKVFGVYNGTKQLSHVMPCYFQNAENPQAELRQHYKKGTHLKWAIASHGMNEFFYLIHERKIL
jgi:hypothetical protein